ncbi:MAG: nucleotidyltransferase domain-containing protein [Nanoarchaeota archaeon]
MNLINLIRQDPDVRRLFGRKELAIIEKQLMSVQLRPSERTRLSRDIRKKLDAVRKLARFQDDFKLKKGGQIKKMVDDAREIILKSRWFPRIRRIILYGSVVKGDATLHSDIDIAIDLMSADQADATLLRKELSGRIDERIDVQVLNVLPEKIKKAAILHHKVVYERSDNRQDQRDRNSL